MAVYYFSRLFYVNIADSFACVVQDLFRLYDLNNYAGVVSVDDLPESSLER